MTMSTDSEPGAGDAEAAVSAPADPAAIRAEDALNEVPPQSRVRGYLSLGLKIVVAVVALTWLSRSKSIDFGTLKVLVDRPILAALDLGMWAFAGIVLPALRFKILLTLADAHPKFLRLLRLQMIALFFNVVVPGNIGGDVLKAYYVARDEAPEKKPTILLMVLVDRIVGLAGLIAIAVLAMIFRGGEIAADPRTKPLIFTVVLLGLGAFGGPIVFALLLRLSGKTLERWGSGPGRLSKLLSELTKSVRLTSAKPATLLLAVLVSMGIHTCALGLFTAFAHAIISPELDIGKIATVFPIGMLSLVLPISPAGVGVGHVAFAELFKLIGIEGGATVFNVYLVGQIAPSLLGAIPYVLEKRAGSLPTT